MAAPAPKRVRKQLIDHALQLPEAWLDHPWGEDVVKVGKKVVVFFGTPDAAVYPLGMTVKLPQSQPMALAQEGVTPSGYGLGKAGWVTVRFDAALPSEMLREWIHESYRAVVPRRLADQLSGDTKALR